MPVTKSAKKALRTATRRREENLSQKTAYKSSLKAVRKAAGSKEAATLMSKAQSTLDKAAKNGTIHPNKAARLKSRAAKLLTTSGTPAEKAAKPAKAKTSTAKAKTSTKKTTASKAKKAS